LHLRNIGRAQSSLTHSNAEILPPIEGLSVSRKFPALKMTVVSEAIFCTSDFKTIHRPATSLGINPDQFLRGDSRER
jgi:hypothetical protein